MSQTPEEPRQDKPHLNRTTDELRRNYRARRRYAHRKTGKTKEEKTLKMLGRLRNEERIETLTKRILDLLLDRTQRLFIEREVIRARKADPNVDVIKVQRHAEKESGKWTKNNVRANLPSHLVVADIMTKHGICGWRDGDNFATWHIAFNNCGGEYKTEFPLDKDDLPIEPPGATRSKIMKRVFDKADKKVRKGRLGIVCDRDRERQRDSRSEWRYFLLRNDKGDGKLDDNGNSPGYDRQIDLMNLRHKGEKHQKALLKEAMSVPIKKSANMVDSVLDAWTKEKQ